MKLKNSMKMFCTFKVRVWLICWDKKKKMKEKKEERMNGEEEKKVT